MAEPTEPFIPRRRTPLEPWELLPEVPKPPPRHRVYLSKKPGPGKPFYYLGDELTPARLKRISREYPPPVEGAGPLPFIILSLSLGAMAALILKAKRAHDLALIQQVEHALQNNGLFLGHYTFGPDDQFDLRLNHPSMHMQLGAPYGPAYTPALVVTFDAIPKPVPRWVNITLPFSQPTRQYAGVWFRIHEYHEWFTKFFSAAFSTYDGTLHHDSGFTQDVFEGLYQINLITQDQPKILTMPMGMHLFPNTRQHSTWSIDQFSGTYLGMSTHGWPQQVATLPHAFEESTATSPNYLALYLSTMNPGQNTIVMDYACALQWGPERSQPPTDAEKGFPTEETQPSTPPSEAPA